jgi:hypothetical protein
MAAIPQSTRNSITLRLLDHAERHWPQLTRVQVTYRGAFGYITGVLRDGGQRIPLLGLLSVHFDDDAELIRIFEPLTRV